jgi:uncharacterized protein YggE
MIGKKYIGIAVVALVAVVGSTVSVLSLSAQDPATATPEPLSSVVATVDAELDAEQTYCDLRSDGITVQGAGIVSVPANIGVVSLGVEVTAETVSAARSEAATAMADVIEAVKEQGVEDDDITTTRFNIRPRTTWVEEEVDLGEGRTARQSREMLIGYRVTNRVRIEIDMTQMPDDTETDAEDADILSKVIDAAADAGGDDVRIDSISFRADQTSESVDQARQLAVQDALHRAGLYAEAFGVEVGTLLSASENVGSRPVFVQEAAAARVVSESLGLDSPSTPVGVGDIEIRADITAKFAIVQTGCVDKAALVKDKDSE